MRDDQQTWWVFWIWIMLLAGGASVMAQDTFNTLPSATTASFNTDNRAFLRNEDANRYAASFGPHTITGCLGATSGSMVMPAFACEAFVDTGFYTNQPSASIDFAAQGAAAADTCWVILTHTTTTTLSGNWTRVSGTRYATDCVTATQPARVVDSLWLMDVTIAASAITTVTDLRPFRAAPGVPIPVERFLSFAAAIDEYDDAGDPPVTLSVTSRVHVTATVTVPNTMSLVIHSGGILSIDLGVTLTINGTLHAGRSQIFNDLSRVRFGLGSVSVIYPEWGGASPSATAAVNVAAINGAIDADNEQGIPVELGNGTFALQQEGTNAWAVELRENLVLQGQGSNHTSLRMADNQANFVRPLSTDSADANGVNNVHVRNLQIDGNQANQPACPEQCHGIFFSGVLDGSITGVEVRNTKGDGIYVHEGQLSAGSQRVRILNNLIHDVKRVGININGGNATLVQGNTIRDILDNWAIKMEADPGGTAKSGNVVVGNVITNVDSGISYSAPGAAHYVDMIVANNYFDGDQAAGGGCMSFRSVERLIVQGNVCRDFINDGILFESDIFDSIIADNVITSVSVNAGISIGGGALTCVRRLVVRGNIVRSGGNDGIRITSCTPDAPGEISIMGNVVTGHTGAPSAGIALLSGDRIAVVGNVLRNNDRGIRLGGGGVAMSLPAITGNMFGGNVTAAVSVVATTNGILFSGNELTNEATLFSGLPSAGADSKYGPNSGMWGFQSGTVTLDGATPTAVTFPITEPNTTYLVQVTCLANETSIWVTGKATTGFNINSSGPHTSVCEWHVTRDD